MLKLHWLSNGTDLQTHWLSFAQSGSATSSPALFLHQLESGEEWWSLRDKISLASVRYSSLRASKLLDITGLQPHVPKTLRLQAQSLVKETISIVFYHLVGFILFNLKVYEATKDRCRFLVWRVLLFLHVYRSVSSSVVCVREREKQRQKDKKGQRDWGSSQMEGPVWGSSFPFFLHPLVAHRPSDAEVWGGVLNIFTDMPSKLFFLCS